MKESPPRRILFRLLTWLVIASQVFSQAAFADSKDLNKAPQNLSEKVAAWSRVDLLEDEDGDAAELDANVTPVPGAAGFAETGAALARRWQEADIRLFVARYLERKRREAGAAFDPDQAQRQLLDKLRRSGRTDLIPAIGAEFTRLRQIPAQPGSPPSGNIGGEEAKDAASAKNPGFTLKDARRLDINAIARSVVMMSRHLFRTKDGTSSPITRKVEDILSRRTIDWDVEMSDHELALYWVGEDYCVFNASISAAYQHIYERASPAKRNALRRDLLLKMTRMVCHEVAGILTGIDDRGDPEREIAESVAEYYVYHRLRTALQPHGWYDLAVGGVADEFGDTIGWLEKDRLKSFRKLYGRFSQPGMLQRLIATLDDPGNELVAAIKANLEDISALRARIRENGGRLDHEKICRLVWNNIGLNPESMISDDSAMPRELLEWLEGTDGPLAHLALAGENMLQPEGGRRHSWFPSWAASGAIEGAAIPAADQGSPLQTIPPALEDRTTPLVPTPLIAGIFDLLCYFSTPRSPEILAMRYFENPTPGDKADIEKALRFLYGAGLAQKVAAGYSAAESARPFRDGIVEVLGYIAARRQTPNDMKISVVENFRTEEKAFEEFKELLISGAAVWLNGKWRLIRPADIARAEQSKAAERSAEQEAAIEAIKARTRKMNMAMAHAGKDAINLSDISVVMKRITPDSVDPRRRPGFATRNVFLADQYNTIVANLRGLIPADNMRIADSNDSAISIANSLLDEKRRVIVLDVDGSLTETVEFGIGRRIKGVQARDYCVVGVDAAAVRGTQGHKGLADIYIAFAHLEAMVKIGIAVLCDNRPLFEDAYEAFTGNRPDEPLLEAFDRKITGIIRALPVSMPFDPNREDERRRLKQFFIDMAA